MTILFITYYWPPSGGPGVQRSLKFTKYLPKFDIHPIVVTVDEKYASYPVIQSDLIKEVPENIAIFNTKSFELLNFYKAFARKGEIPYSGFVNESNASLVQKISRFLRGNLLIPDARKGWNKYAYQAAMEIISKKKIDLIFISTPPHSTQLVGLKLKKETGIPIIADMRDPWTDIYYYKMLYHLGFAKRKNLNLERKVLENSDAVLVVSDSMKSIFIKKSEKLDPDKIHVIPNGFDEEDFIVTPDEKKDEFSVLYTGTISEDYGIEMFIKAFKSVVDKYPDIRITLKFNGIVSESLKELFNEAGLEASIEFNGYVPHKDSIKNVLGTSALLLAIPKIENNEGILTGKLFEYLASKKPIICIGPERGDAAKIINRCKAGEVFDYSKQTEIEDYLSKLILKWIKSENIENKDDTYLNYSRIKQADMLSHIIKDLTK